MRRALLVAAVALWPSLALAQFNGGGGISNSGGVQVNGGVAGNVAAYSNAGTIGPNSGITFSGTTPTITAGTLSGITTLPGSGNSIDASGNVIGASAEVTSTTVPAGYGINKNTSNTLGFVVGGTSAAQLFTNTLTLLNTTVAGSQGPQFIANNNSNHAVQVGVTGTTFSSAPFSSDQAYVYGSANSGGLLLGTPGATAITMVTNNTAALNISGAQAISMPGLAASSAAQTGTVCWTTGGNLTVDTTLACLSSSRRFKMDDRPLDAGLATVMKLRPVAYQLRPEYNPEHLGEQVGLMAEEVGKIDDRLIAHDPDGEARGVRYMQLTAVLVRAVQQQQAEIEDLRSCRLRILGRCWF